MAYFSGNLHRPLSAMAAVAVATMSTDIPDRFHNPKPSESVALSKPETSEPSVSRISVSNMSFVKNPSSPIPISHKPDSIFSSFASSTTSPPALLTLYQYAKLGKPSKDHEFKPTSSHSDVLYRWHLPDPNADSGLGKCSLAKSQTVVVLLGWLGAKQRHLRRYAEWYTSRGFHVVTFTFPMADVVSYKVGGKVEESVGLLADHLSEWVAEESGKKLVFHTFSNTGWLTYGALLEKFQNQDPSVMEKIKGCIVDSAPVASPDPQVWASGFSAAFLKKRSVATKGTVSSNSVGTNTLVATKFSGEPKPAVGEGALLAVLEKFFEVVLNLPSINRRLHDVFALLSSEQPKCPQLYIYSSADRVIPAKSVESFIEKQRRAGHEVWASGFSAAFLKKRSVATKGTVSSNSVGTNTLVATKFSGEPKPAVGEGALLAVLEKFFEVVLNLPSINRRLHDVFALLSSEQPKCPQLYIYSSADRVIPAKSVESFIEKQRKAGHEVRACDFLSSPHVDHFRNHPGLYTSQLTIFLEDCVLTCCKDS